MRIVLGLWIVVLLAAGAWYFTRGGNTRATTLESAAKTGVHEESEPVVLEAPAVSATEERKPLATSASEPATPAVAASGAESAITGRVVDERGRAISDAELRAEHGGPTLAKSGADGRFRISAPTRAGVAVFDLPYVASHPDFVAQHFRSQGESGGTHDVGDVVLLRGGRVSGRVVDESELAVADARVLITSLRALDVESARRADVWDAIAETKSAADGTFEFDALAPGRVRVWALKKTYLNGISAPVDVRVGEETRDVALAVARETREDFVDITVLNPDGTPCSNAAVVYEYESPRQSGSGTEDADESGHLHFRFQFKVPYSFSARDPKREFGPGVAARVEPGSNPLTLQLTELRALVLEVVDEHDVPIRAFTTETVLATEDPNFAMHSHDGYATQSNGRARVVVPLSRFSIHVEALGYEGTVLGPFDPGTTPSTLRATLKARPGLSGRVVQDGQPVAQATVRAGTRITRGQRRMVNGFPVDKSFDGLVETRTAEDGTFALSPRTSGEYFLQADKPSAGLAYVGPFTFDEHMGISGLEIALVPGGAIEGRLLLPVGESAVGALVGASFGDGRAFTVRVDATEHFRFEHLTPGQWHVKRCEEEISPSRTTSTSWPSDEAFEIPWNCTVRSGETTHFDLDLHVDPRPRIRGKLSFNGRAAVGITVVASSSSGFGDDSPHTDVAPDGRFELRVPSEGTVTMRFTDPSANHGDAYFMTRLEAHAGDNPWERDLKVGTIELTRTGTPEPSATELWLRCSSSEDSIWMNANITLAARATYTLTNALAGKWIVSDPADDHRPEITLEVRAQEVTRVNVP